MTTSYVSSTLTIGFMLFHESPRWLIATGKLDKACDVLNDIAHRRWNNTKAHFTNDNISSIHKNDKKRFYTFHHLFSSPRLAKQSFMQILSVFTYAMVSNTSPRLAKQSFMQILSVFTYAMVSNTYLYTVGRLHDSVITFIFLDGIFRLFTPFIIIFLDLSLPSFGRKIQFVGALVIERWHVNEMNCGMDCKAMSRCVRGKRQTSSVSDEYELRTVEWTSRMSSRSKKTTTLDDNLAIEI
ncbi:hypothetical protein DICVIV_12069 [Dictyocaulus viviparus]|uniref:Major facilitator superfamily (MFS) profile domain-containing protein n=1 Tax=Dictyocaulus viviparus TaxID=29172 RepID=A0A0D8XE51_DICVI|nr:hypothetical protein DICVIV_12069 [Dictyocaulus viviparus]